MTRDVKITMDVNIARMMLGVAGFWEASNMTDDEVFEKVLTMIEAYGAKSEILEQETRKAKR